MHYATTNIISLHILISGVV